MAIYSNGKRIEIKKTIVEEEGKSAPEVIRGVVEDTAAETRDAKNLKRGSQTMNSGQSAHVQDIVHDTAHEEASYSQPTAAAQLPAEDTSKLNLLKSRSFDIRNFHKDFSDNSEAVLMELLNMQSNDAPLKKGGDGIAYRADAIIMNNRQSFSIPENNLFDLISGAISSRPDDNAYIITGKEASQKLGLVHGDNAYVQLRNAAKSLATKPLLFDITLPNGKKRTLNVAWYEVLTYFDREMTDDDEESYVSFQPTKFFKALMISSTISHGAHYNIKVSSQIHSRYSRNLYYFFESRKNYMASPNATPGEITLTLDELRSLLGYPETYKAGDIRRKILDPALEMNSIPGIDFNFEYEPVKKGKRVIGIKFIIHRNYMISKRGEAQPQAIAESDLPVLEMLRSVGFSGNDANRIVAAYKKNNRDIPYLMRSILKLETSKNIENRVAFLIALLNGTVSTEEKQKKSQTASNNKFNNFHQREYDEDELEKLLLDNDL